MNGIIVTELLEKVGQYYLDAKIGETSLYKLFTNLNFLDDPQEVFVRICVVDSFYSTHLSTDAAHLHLCKAICENKDKIRNLQGKELFDETLNINEVSELYNAILNFRSEDPKKRHWSFVSKFLHFCNPKVFPLYDSIANVKVKWKSENYADLCKRYREIWNSITEQDREQLKAGLKTIAHDVGLSEITPLTAIDKYFYLA